MESIYFLAANETLKEEIEAVLRQASVAEQKKLHPHEGSCPRFPQPLRTGPSLRRAGSPGHHYPHRTILRIVPSHPGYPRTVPALFDQ